MDCLEEAASERRKTDVAAALSGGPQSIHFSDSARKPTSRKPTSLPSDSVTADVRKNEFNSCRGLRSVAVPAPERSEC